MFQGRRVVSTTAYGRRRYVEILAHYLLGLRGIIDEHHFWINTDCREDLNYVEKLVRDHPDFFRLIVDPSPFVKKRPLPRLCNFWRRCDEENTLYLRFDDDIVWLAGQAVERLLEFRLEHPDYLLVFPNIVNNSLCSHLHQRLGILPPTPLVEYDCMGRVSWRRWETALENHEAFLRNHEAGNLERYYFPRWELNRFERFSINAMCWFGRDLIPWASHFRGDEEALVSSIVPRRTNRMCCVVGDALMVHFAYFTQRTQLEANAPQVLDRYRDLVLQQQLAATG